MNCSVSHGVYYSIGTPPQHVGIVSGKTSPAPLKWHANAGSVLCDAFLCVQVVSYETLFERQVENIKMLHYITRRYDMLRGYAPFLTFLASCALPRAPL